MYMLSGSYTAIITPFKNNAVDYNGLERLVDFQIENGITGILAVGTTGESPTLTWKEHNTVIEIVANKTQGRSVCIAGTGSNNTLETLEATQHASEAGVKAVLLVDPYYNGPSSLEIRKEYIEPIAKAFPNLDIIPYIIPGRTGAQLLPEDLGVLNKAYKNVRTVKEATGNIENMRRTRKCCGTHFTILSGDDGMTYQMMTDSQVAASGVISVMSNVIPGAVAEMVHLLEQGNLSHAQILMSKIAPLFDLVTVKTEEETSFGKVTCRARNPLAIKTLMSILGMPSGDCRKPLGKMTIKGLEVLLETARKIQKTTPEIFKPIENFFEVNVEERLNTPFFWENLCYTSYEP